MENNLIISSSSYDFHR